MSMESERISAEFKLVMNHYAWLRSLAYVYARTQFERDDLVQETLLKVYEAIKADATDVEHVRAFLSTVCRNVAITWARHNEVVEIQYVPEEQLADMEEFSGDVVEEIITESELERFFTELRTLPKKTQHVILLKRVMGYQQREIAAQLGISENTIEDHIKRAGRLLSEALGEKVAAWGNGRQERTRAGSMAG